MKSIRVLWESEFFRFLVAGGANTAITYVLYLAALLLVPYPVAYTLSYVCGIAISYWLTCWFVFRRRMALASALPYPLVYVIQYVWGLVLLSLFVARFGLDKRLAPAGVVICTVPVTFVLSRVILRRAPQRT